MMFKTGVTNVMRRHSVIPNPFELTSSWGFEVYGYCNIALVFKIPFLRCKDGHFNGLMVSDFNTQWRLLT